MSLVMLDGLLRDERCSDEKQAQTRSTFAYKWQREESYRSAEMREMSREWLSRRYAALWSHAAWTSEDDRPLVLDAGCGSSYSAQILFEGKLAGMRYVGADISRAVDVAARSFASEGIGAAFVQADLMDLPFPDETFDIAFSEGVLHHTPDTRAALASVARKVKRGGAIGFYVYRLKAPVREFTDDFIRDRIADLPSEQAWDLLLPLSKLGEALGRTKAVVHIEDAIEILGIPAGPIDVQRLFYWYFCKMFYREELTLEEHNHINFDWFTPRYAHRQTEEQVRTWCGELGLAIDSLTGEEAGFTVVASRL